MAGVTIGDIFFIALVCGLIWGLTALMNRSRRIHPASPPAIPDSGPGDDLMRRALGYRSVAVVGDFSDPEKDSSRIFRFLEGKGYDIRAVDGGAVRKENLSGAELVVMVSPAGEPVSWAQAAANAEAKAVWMEKGTISPEAMHIAIEGGMAVVMDHAIELEHRRLLES